MSKEAQKAGITPYILRLAAYYMTMGEGQYCPKGYAFDRVVVRLSMPWTAKAEITASTQVMVVEFYQGTQRIRWVEFSICPAGFGGDAVLKDVSASVLRKIQPATDAQPNQDQSSSNKPPKV